MSSASMFYVPNARGAPRGATCWICLDEGNGDGGEDDPLMRTCACRGDSGWVHTSCLAGYLGSKSTTLYGKFGVEETRPTPEFVRVWYECPQCKQEFKGEQSLGLAKVRFQAVSDNDSISKDDRRYLSAQLFLAAKSPEDPIKCWKILEDYLAIARASSRKPLYMLPCELEGLHLLACTLKDLVLCEGKSKRIMERSMALMKRCEELAIEFPTQGYAQRECDTINMIVRAKIIGGEKNLAAATKYWRKQTKEIEAYYGPDHERTIASEEVVAESLFEEGKIAEAVDYMQGVLNQSRRVLGPKHFYSEKQEAKLAEYRQQLSFPRKQGFSPVKTLATLTSENPTLDGTEVEIIRPTKGDDDKIIIRMGDGKKVKVPASKLVFFEGTPVVIKDLVSSPHLNGESATVGSFNEKKERYVLIREDGTKVLVKPKNVAYAGSS